MSRAASSTVRVMGPACASGPNGLAGYIGILPWVGLNPTMPQNADGISTLPPPSVPTATGTIPDAQAAAAQQAEPPGIRRRYNGLRVTLVVGVSLTPSTARP